jgi:PAS domain S-box-containing protein
LSIGLWFLNFTYEYVDKNKNWIFYVLGVLAASAALVTVSTGLVIEGYTIYRWGPAENTGALFIPFVVLLIVIPVLYGLFLIYRKAENPENILMKRTAPLIISGSVISLVITLISDVVLPNVLNMQHYFRFAESISVIQSIFIFTAVYRYNLFGIGIEDFSYNIFKLMNDGVVITNRSNKIIHINQGTENIFGIRSKRDLHNKIYALTAEMDSSAPGEQDERIIECNGADKYISVSRNKIYQSGENIGYIILLKDITEQKKYEQKLVESEATFSELFDSAPDALIVIDDEGKIIRVNQQVEILFGYLKYELLGQKVNKLLPERFRHLHENHVSNYMLDPHKRQMGAGLELLGRKKDGIEFPVDVMLSPLSRVNKKYTLGTVRDITDLKNNERKLQASEQQYKTVIQTLPYGIVETGIDGTIKMVNDAFAEIHGYKVKELLGIKIWDLAANPKDKITIRTFLEEAQKGDLNPQTEFAKRKKKGGSKIDVQIDWNYIKDTEGNTEGFISIYTDITEKLKIEQSLQKNRLMLSQAEQLSHLGSWEWDVVNDKLYWSGELYRIFGLNRNEFEPTMEEFGKRIHPDDRERVINTIKNSLKSVRPFFHFESIVKPGGEVRVLSTRGIVQTNSRNEVTGIYGSCLDVTEFKKIESDLLKSQKQLRALSANLQSTREEERTHIAREIHDELGQVLTAINMDIVLMIDEMENGGQLSESVFLSNLKSIEELIGKLIRSVQDISTELRPDILDHIGLIPALEWYLKEFSRRYKIEFELNKTIEDLEIEEFKKLDIFRIFQEALTNVARHSKASLVSVELAKSNDNFEIKVIDNGIGISEDTIEDVKSIGIIGIRERVLLINGKVTIKKGDNGGTILHLIVPLK